MMASRTAPRRRETELIREEAEETGIDQPVAKWDHAIALRRGERSHSSVPDRRRKYAGSDYLHVPAGYDHFSSLTLSSTMRHEPASRTRTSSLRKELRPKCWTKVATRRSSPSGSIRSY